ncbi:hypothetical protein CRE_07551 [Caenorhabditis remanei]|uniref:Uncharacterized protein n=1 Tax=Caenorhabditis remanei TaxID=31234 RepID=E3M2H6_CAERE|nr:hypothetical protein CRE_07551 [Caenorhabditis remanei]
MILEFCFVTLFRFLQNIDKLYFSLAPGKMKWGPDPDAELDLRIEKNKKILEALKPVAFERLVFERDTILQVFSLLFSILKEKFRGFPVKFVKLRFPAYKLLNCRTPDIYFCRHKKHEKCFGFARIHKNHGLITVSCTYAYHGHEPSVGQSRFDGIQFACIRLFIGLYWKHNSDINWNVHHTIKCFKHWFTESHPLHFISTYDFRAIAAELEYPELADFPVGFVFFHRPPLKSYPTTEELLRLDELNRKEPHKRHVHPSTFPRFHGDPDFVASKLDPSVENNDPDTDHSWFVNRAHATKMAMHMLCHAVNLRDIIKEEEKEKSKTKDVTEEWFKYFIEINNMVEHFEPILMKFFDEVEYGNSSIDVPPSPERFPTTSSDGRTGPNLPRGWPEAMMPGITPEGTFDSEVVKNSLNEKLATTMRTATELNRARASWTAVRNTIGDIDHANYLKYTAPGKVEPSLFPALSDGGRGLLQPVFLDSDSDQTDSDDSEQEELRLTKNQKKRIRRKRIKQRERKEPEQKRKRNVIEIREQELWLAGINQHFKNTVLSLVLKPII